MGIELISRTGEKVTVNESEAKPLLASGQYGLDQNKTYSVVANGEVIQADAARIMRGIENNAEFELESPEAKQARLDQEQYGGTASTVGAFAEGMVRDLTMGGYDVGARVVDAALGTDITEGIAGRKRANPTAATAGEVVGMVGSLTNPVGWGKTAAKGAVKAAAKVGERSLLRSAGEALGTGVRYSPSGMTNALGRATEEAAQGILGRGIVGKAAGMGAAGALEGGLYTAGYAASEAALADADPHEIGEAAISGLWSGATTGAILGGLLGAGTGIVGKGAAAVGAKYGESLQTMAGRRFFKSLGGQQSELTTLLSRAGGETEDQLLRRLADDVGNYTVEATNKKGQKVQRQILRPGTTARDVLEDIELGRQQVGRKLGETIDTVSDYIEKEAPGLRPDMQGFYTLMEERAAKIQALGLTSSNREFIAASKNFEQMLNRLTTPGAPPLTLKELWAFRKELDSSSLMKQRSGLTIADPAKEELRELRNAWENEIRNSVDKVIENIPDLKNKMGKSYSELKRQYMSFANASELAEKGSARLTGNRMFSLTDNIWGAAQAAGGIASGNTGKVVGALGGSQAAPLLSDLTGQEIDPITGGLIGLAGMAVHKQIRTRGSSTAAALLMGITKRNGSITKGLNSLVTGTRQATVKLTGKQIAKEETKKILGGKENEDLTVSYKRYQKGLNLEALQAQELQNRDPSPLAQSVASAAIRKTDYLTQVMPIGMRDSAQPWNQKWQPNPTEVIRYSRKVEIANNPQKVFTLAKEGRLTPDHMEALATVYPVYYEEIQNKGREMLADSKTNLTYRERQQIGMLLALEDATYDLQNVGRMQESFEPPTPPSTKPVNLPPEFGQRDKTAFNV